MNNDPWDILRFNSSLVRLEVQSDRASSVVYAGFQFQLGSIRRGDKRFTYNVVAWFQFQLGSIRRKPQNKEAKQSLLVSIPAWFD